MTCDPECDYSDGGWWDDDEGGLSLQEETEAEARERMTPAERAADLLFDPFAD